MIFQLSFRRGSAIALLLVGTAGVPAVTLALPSEAPEFDPLGRTDAPAVPSVWDRPTTPAPVVVVRPPEPQPAAPERTLSPNPLWEIPLSNLAATRERPIFSPSRRPPPPVVVAAPPSKAPPPTPKAPRVERPQLTLVGTIDGEESFAIFVDQATRAALRLKIGDDYQGWKLRAVQGRDVTLERDQQTTILSLPQPGTAAPGQPTARNESFSEPRAAEIAASQRGLRH